jgi:putative ABC transport system permease protein
MNIEEGLRQSFEVIRGNKVRAFLTMLGINFGVGSLIAIAIVGLAFRETINDKFGQFGSTLVWAQVNNRAYVRGESKTTMDPQDIEYFDRGLPGLKYHSTVFTTIAEASYQGKGRNVGIYGVQPDHFQLLAFAIEKGRPFLQQDLDLHRAVCVLRPDIATQLFGSDDPIGKSINLFDRTFQVIGLLQEQKMGFVSDGSNNNTVFLPAPFVSERVWGGKNVKYFVYLMKFDTMENVDTSIERIGTYLSKKYGLIRGEKRFIVNKSDTFISIAENVLDIVSTLILVIAGISLIVGGLGIMNIMLVTVTERTREIGIRMAVGAKSTDILAQFIIEAVTICVIGGGIGVVFGTSLAALACALVGWPFLFSALAVIVALTIATLIGLVFGIYPAYKASKMTPIDALRVEQ